MIVTELKESEPIEQSFKHKITSVDIQIFSDKPEKMYKLYIKANEKWHSFRRARYTDYGLKELKNLVNKYNPETKFFCTHGVGNPIKEFNDREDGLKATPFESITSIENVGDYWSFIGNHKNYSMAFGYKIFSEDLANIVNKLLQHSLL